MRLCHLLPESEDIELYSIFLDRRDYGVSYRVLHYALVPKHRGYGGAYQTFDEPVVLCLFRRDNRNHPAPMWVVGYLRTEEGFGGRLVLKMDKIYTTSARGYKESEGELLYQHAKDKGVAPPIVSDIPVRFERPTPRIQNEGVEGTPREIVVKPPPGVGRPKRMPQEGDVACEVLDTIEYEEGHVFCLVKFDFYGKPSNDILWFEGSKGFGDRQVVDWHHCRIRSMVKQWSTETWRDAQRYGRDTVDLTKSWWGAPIPCEVAF